MAFLASALTGAQARSADDYVGNWLTAADDGFAQFDGSAWSQGWAIDSRTNHTYHSKIRLKDGKLHARYDLGHEEWSLHSLPFPRLRQPPDPGAQGFLVR